MRSFGQVPAPDVVCRDRLRRGAATFVALTAVGLLGLFAFGSIEGTPPRLETLRPAFLVLALACVALDAVLGGLRFQVFIRRAHPRSPLWLPIRADLAGRFVGAVTPSQSGGGPAQVFVLHRGGIPLAESLSLLLVNLIATLLVLVLAGGLSAWIFRDHFGNGALLALMRYGFVVVGALLALLVTALLRPDLVSRPLARLAHRSGSRTLPGRVAGLLVASLEQYQAACDRFVRQSPWLLVVSLGLTVLIYLNKFGLAWLVMRGLGVERDFALTVALLALVHFCVFLAPSPGGSGIAEVATGAFVSILLPGSLVGPFTLGYRLLLVYLPAAVGAFVLLAELGPGHRRAPTPTPRAPEPVAAPRWSWPGRVPLGLVVLALTLGAASPARGGGTHCPLCGPGAPPTTPLLGPEVEAAAAALAERNRRELERIGALLRDGQLGPPESPEARSRAQLLARLALANWYSFLLPQVTDTDRVWTVRTAALASVVARYCEAVVVPLPRLRELRLGRGHVCARYDLGGSDEEGWTVLGGRRLRYRVGDRKAGGTVRRMLGLDWSSTGMGKVEVLVEEHYGFRRTDTRLAHEDGSHFDLFLALDLTGAWVSRYGVHRVGGFAFWASRPMEAPPYLPATPRVGSAIYLPGLVFALPILPDIDLDDVRVLGLPMPFLDVDDLRMRALPSWLPSDGELGLDAWTSEGPPPPHLHAHFPTTRGETRSVAFQSVRVSAANRR
jgi:uncharacterized protein (TIRG00374 family)